MTSRSGGTLGSGGRLESDLVRWWLATCGDLRRQVAAHKDGVCTLLSTYSGAYMRAYATMLTYTGSVLGGVPQVPPPWRGIAYIGDGPLCGGGKLLRSVLRYPPKYLLRYEYLKRGVSAPLDRYPYLC